MKETFYISPNDKGLSIILKREANIILASLDDNSDKYKIEKGKYEEVLSVIRTIEGTEPQCDDDIDFILNTISKIWKIGILSPLTLTNNEFNDYKSHGAFHNKRYPFIYHCGNGKIYNQAAYKLYIKSIYDVTINSQIDTIAYNLSITQNVLSCVPIFISKGGVITGDYIQQCEIRKDIIDKHSFTIQSIVNIPVSKIIDNDITIYTVDHREPKLKVLKEFYNVPIYTDNIIANKHYDIRKFKKLTEKRY